MERCQTTGLPRYGKTVIQNGRHIIICIHPEHLMERAIIVYLNVGLTTPLGVINLNKSALFPCIYITIYLSRFIHVAIVTCIPACTSKMAASVFRQTLQGESSKHVSALTDCLEMYAKELNLLAHMHGHSLLQSMQNGRSPTLHIFTICPTLISRPVPGGGGSRGSDDPHPTPDPPPYI